MSTELELQDAWPGFVASVATVAVMRPAEVRVDSRVIEDLGLDSLGLLELALMLMGEYGMASLSDELAGRTWEGVTVGELYQEWQMHGSAG